MSLQTGNVDPKVSWLRTVHLEETQHLQEKAKQHAQQQQEVDISEQQSEHKRFLPGRNSR